MSNSYDQNREASVTQLRRARRQGKFAKSREITSTAVWIGGLAVLGTIGANWWDTIAGFATGCWRGTQFDLETANRAVVGQAILNAEHILWSILLPFLALIALVCVLAHASQTEFRWFPGLIKPSPSQLSPQRYVQKTFTIEHIFSIFIGVAKFSVLVAVLIWVLWSDVPNLLATSRWSLRHGAAESIKIIFLLGIKLGIAALIIGLFDYLVRWWANRRRLRMSEQEVREERRATEPAPEIGARHRLLSQRRYNDRGLPEPHRE